MNRPLEIPPTFPDPSKPVTVRTASGHQHRLLAGWHYLDHDTGAHNGYGRRFLPHLAGVTAAGYFLSVAVDHVESLEQGAAIGDVPTIGGRPVADVSV